MYGEFPIIYFFYPHYASTHNMMLSDRTLSTCTMCPLLYHRRYRSCLFSQQKDNCYRTNTSAITDTHTAATMKALADAIIPRTPADSIQSFGALDSHTDEYLIWSLDNYLTVMNNNLKQKIPLAKPSADMLDIAAEQLISTGGNEEPINFYQFPGGGIFAALAPNDRLRSITLLEQLKVNLSCLPVPLRDNPGFVLSITGAIKKFAMFGYYSEWSGYGSTRLETPDKRKLEHFPIGWKQVGYPGTSRIYHALRGYLFDKFTE